MTIYEPRAFWDVLRVDATSTTQSVQMNRNYFYNGTQWPITITKLGIAPVQYGYSTGIGFVGANSRSVESLVAQGLGVQLAARQRYDFSKNSIAGGNFTALQNNPVSGDFVAGGGVGNTVLQSSRFGAVYAKFDRTLSVPPKGAVEFTPSVLSYPAGTPGIDYPFPKFGVLFHEVGGQLSFGGQGRVKQQATLEAGSTAAGSSVYNDWIPRPAINAPAGPDPAGALGQPFPPGHVFTAKDFVTQDASVRPGQPSFYEGITVMIDQLEMDDYIATQTVVGDASIASLANFVGVRARMTEGGTKQEWWRPGMPLSLACPDMSPALIHELPAPFTMEPGEQLEVFVNVPAAADPEVAETYSVAVAVLGFATIEGVTV